MQFVKRCYGLCGIYGRFDSKIRFEIESDGRFDSNAKNDSQVPSCTTMTWIDLEHLFVFTAITLYVCLSSADVIADGCPYDEESQCTIRLDDNSVVCLRAVNRYLALVCQLPVQHYRYEGLHCVLVFLIH